MDKNLTSIFVYGSLRSGFQNPAYAYISKHFTLVSKAKVKGRLYDMGSFPVAVPADDETYIVGELYQHNNPSEFGCQSGARGMADCDQRRHDGASGKSDRRIDQPRSTVNSAALQP